MSTTEPDPGPDDQGPPPPTPAPPLPPAGLPSAPPLTPSEASTPRSDQGRRRQVLIGGLVGVVLYGLLVTTSMAAGGSDQGAWVLSLFFGMIVLTIVMVIAGGLLVAFGRTRSFGIGLLIAIAIGVFVSGGVCVALIAGASANTG